MTIWVSARSDDASHSLAIDAHKVVRVRSGLHSVNSDTDTSVGTVFETDGESGTRSEFSVELGFGRSGTDSSPGDAVGNELGAVCQLLKLLCELLAHEMVSSSSHPTGRPEALMSQSSSRAIFKPLLI